jgi:hypothetical protein
MGLMARLGGRSSRKTALALFDDKEAIDLSSLLGLKEADAFSSSDVLTPESGWTNVTEELSYIDGGHLVLNWLVFDHAAALAIESNGDHNAYFVADLPAALAPPFAVGGRGVLRTTAGVWKSGVTTFASPNTGVGFISDVAVASTANLEVVIPNLRVPRPRS